MWSSSSITPPCSLKQGLSLNLGLAFSTSASSQQPSDPLVSVPFRAGVKGVHGTIPTFTQSFISIEFAIVCTTLGHQTTLFSLPWSSSPFFWGGGGGGGMGFVKSYLEAKSSVCGGSSSMEHLRVELQTLPYKNCGFLTPLKMLKQFLCTSLDWPQHPLCAVLRHWDSRPACEEKPLPHTLLPLRIQSLPDFLAFVLTPCKSL